MVKKFKNIWVEFHLVFNSFLTFDLIFDGFEVWKSMVFLLFYNEFLDFESSEKPGFHCKTKGKPYFFRPQNHQKWGQKLKNCWKQMEFHPNVF